MLYTVQANYESRSVITNLRDRFREVVGAGLR